MTGYISIYLMELDISMLNEINLGRQTFRPNAELYIKKGMTKAMQHKQNQCARSRSRFDQLMSDLYWGF